MNQPFPPQGSDSRRLTNEMVEALQHYDPAFFATWAESLRAAWQSPTLDERTERVIALALDSVLHSPSLLLQQDVHAAFDAGSTIAEMLEAVMQLEQSEGGGHSLHDGVEALAKVVAEREASGLPAPHRGAGLSAAEFIPERAITTQDLELIPPIFPYMFPHPRIHHGFLKAYAPGLSAAFNEWKTKVFMLREDLTRKTQELLSVAIHALNFRPAPFTDHHIHTALNVGCNVQELVEAVLVAGRRGAGISVIRFGLTAIGRVIDERQLAGVAVPGLEESRYGVNCLPADAAGFEDRG